MRPAYSLTLAEAAAILKVSPSFMAKMARAGELPAGKVGRAWVFLARDVDAYLQGRIAAATALRNAMLTQRSRRKPLPTLS